MADKLRTLQALEALQAKYIGTGHADTTRHDWTNNIVRDSYASYLGHPEMLSYISLGMGEAREITRAKMVEGMVRGVGPPRDVDGELAAIVGVEVESGAEGVEAGGAQVQGQAQQGQQQKSG